MAENGTIAIDLLSISQKGTVYRKANAKNHLPWTKFRQVRNTDRVSVSKIRTDEHLRNEMCLQIIKETEEDIIASSDANIFFAKPKVPLNMDVFNRFLEALNVTRFRGNAQLDPDYLKQPIMRQMKTIHTFSRIYDKELLALRATSLRLSSLSFDINSLLNAFLKQWLLNQREIVHFRLLHSGGRIDLSAELILFQLTFENIRNHDGTVSKTRYVLQKKNEKTFLYIDIQTKFISIDKIEENEVRDLLRVLRSDSSKTSKWYRKENEAAMPFTNISNEQILITGAPYIRATSISFNISIIGTFFRQWFFNERSIARFRMTNDLLRANMDMKIMFGGLNFIEIFSRQRDEEKSLFKSLYAVKNETETKTLYIEIGQGNICAQEVSIDDDELLRKMDDFSYGILTGRSRI